MNREASEILTNCNFQESYFEHWMAEIVEKANRENRVK